MGRSPSSVWRVLGKYLRNTGSSMGCPCHVSGPDAGNWCLPDDGVLDSRLHLVLECSQRICSLLVLWKRQSHQKRLSGDFATVCNSGWWRTSSQSDQYHAVLFCAGLRLTDCNFIPGTDQILRRRMVCGRQPDYEPSAYGKRKQPGVHRYDTVAGICAVYSAVGDYTCSTAD